MATMTTMKVAADLRDRLAKLASRHERPLGVELAALVHAAEEREWWSSAEDAVRRLQADRDEWAAYLAEVDEWDAVSGDGLPDARSEWPELHQEPGQ